jgi:hypothetical protein
MAMTTSRLPDADADAGQRWHGDSDTACPCAMASARPLSPIAVAMRDDVQSDRACI